MDIQASILNTVRANRSDDQSASARENSGVAFGSLMRLAAGRTAQSATSGSGNGSGGEQRISSEGAAQSAETALARMAGEKSADDAEGGQTLPPSEVMDALEALLAKLGIDIPEEIGEILDEDGIEAAVKQLMATLSSSLKAALAGDGVDDDLDDQMDDQMADATELLADADEETLGAALAALIDVQMTGADRVESLSTRMSGWAQEISGLGGGLSGLAAMFGRESAAIGRSRDSGPQTIVPQQNASGESGDAEAEIVGARPTGNGSGSSRGGTDGDFRGRDGGANPDLRGRQFNDALFRLGADAPIDDGDAPSGLRTTFAAAGSDTMSMTPTSSAIGQGATAAGGAAAGLAAEAAAQRPGAGATPVQDQIALHLKKLADNGGDRLRLQLQPARLGGIDIVMEISRDGRVQAVIMADKAETLSLLQRDSRALEQALREADLTVDPDSLRFDMADRQDRNANGDDGASGSDRSLGDHLWMQGDKTADAADIIQPRASSLRAVDITI